MSEVIILLSGLIIGWLTFPLIMFLRARKDSAWDDSNMTNIYRVLAHLAVHPGDFAIMQYPDGKKPFPYLGSDELSEVVKTRPSVAD